MIKGDISDNITLKDGDLIFIPVASKKVEVSGAFQRNAVFELQEHEYLTQLIEYAGGFTDDSYLMSAQIRRKTQQGKSWHR